MATRPYTTCVEDLRADVVALADVVKTAALAQRRPRPSDFEAEARALGELAQELAHNPRGVLQRVVDTAVTLCAADSAGISILERDNGRKIFRWHAIAGAFAANVRGTLPADASPCGVVVMRDQTALFDRPERHFVALRGVEPPIFETVLVPWGSGDGPAGTLWAIAHSPDRHFDSEDARLLTSLARFADAGWHSVQEPDSVARELADRAAEERVKVLFNQLLTVQEDERRRIAREIHDQIGQQITALRIALETLEAHSEGQQLAARAQRASQLARELDDSIDFLTWDLRPAALDLLGLGTELANLAQGWSERFGVPVDYHAVGMDGVRLAPHLEINIYRITQEALHNVHRHAGSCTVSIVLERVDGELILTIEDDGRGFDGDTVDARAPHHMGLVSMRERAALMGGRIDIESSPGKGTAVYVRVPLDGEGG